MANEGVRKKPAETSKIITQLSPWNSNQNIIWLASTLALHRNIEKFKFPQKLDTERKKHILSLVTKTLFDIKGLDHPFAVGAEELAPFEKNFLLEHFLIFEGFQEARTGEAFVLDDSGQFLALLNLKDHIQLRYTDVSGDLEGSWAKLVAVENGLAPTCNFAFSQKFGFLTADPAISGTGLIVTAYLHLPALIHLNELQDFFEKEKNEAILCTGIQGNPDEFIGDMLAVRNAYTIGVNEESIIGALRSAILKFVIAEKHARNRIKSEMTPIIKDKVSRALGTLQFSYQLDTVEALSTISALKLGIELGWVTGVSVEEINRLFFTCRKAHLSSSLKEKIANEDEALKRAEYLREKTKAATASIQR